MNKEIVYNNLRTEMNDTFKRQDNYFLTAYTVTVAIWAFAVENKNEWLALLPMIILIPISLRVLNLRYNTCNIAAFISVYLEEDAEYDWENMREKSPLY